MNGEETLVIDLPAEVLKELQKKADAKNYSNAGNYLKELVTGFILIFAFMLAFQNNLSFDKSRSDYRANELAND